MWWRRSILNFLALRWERTGRGIYIRAHRKSLEKAKEKLKEKTCRSQARNVAQRLCENVKDLIRGWIGYYYMASMKNTFAKLE